MHYFWSPNKRIKREEEEEEGEKKRKKREEPKGMVISENAVCKICA